MTTEERKTVELTLAGETRTVEIARYSPNHCWYAETAIVCKFRTGTKRHTVYRPGVVEKNGKFHFSATNVVHNNHCFPLAWAKTGDGSGWTGTMRATN